MDEKYHLALKTAFASEYAFAIKAQNFHWNVEGPLFVQLHELFERIYTEVYGSIDTFAEQLRALDIYTPASLQKFSMLTKVEDENFSICEVRSGGVDIATKFDAKANIQAVSITQ